MAIGSGFRQNRGMISPIKRAKEAVRFRFAPYSKFKVAAEVLGDNNQIYTAVHVENASHGLSRCAERTAICNAIASGARYIPAVVIYTSIQRPPPPCGDCRQIAQEFGPAVTVLAVCDFQLQLSWTLPDLLPLSFTQEQLSKPSNNPPTNS
jgi:cytidine deaminase